MNNKNLNLFFDILPGFLQSGVPLDESLENISSFEEFEEDRKCLLKINEDIKSGESFAESFCKHIMISDPVILQLIKKLIKKGEEEGLLVEFCKNISMRISLTDDISLFFFDLYLLIKSGTRILEGLKICADKYKNNKKLSVAVNQIKDNITSGSTLYDAFAQHPSLFSKSFISLIKVGEETGELSYQFLKISEISNKQLIYKKKSNKIDICNENFKDPKVFEKWIDTNPFPLAIVLREYISLKDDDLAKFRLLLKFFECSVAFLNTIYFGAFRENDKKFSLIKNLLRDDKKIQFKRLTFGDWVQIYALISKQTRILLDQEKEFSKEIFSDDELDLPKVLSDRKLVNIFLDALKVRNTQEAHGSWVDEEEATKMNNKLFDLLETFKNHMGNIWDKKELIRVESTEAFSENNFLHQYSNLMGSHTIFKRKSKKIPHILFKDNLYLISSKNLKPIKLEKFMQISEAPKKIKNACYFYNKINNKGRPHFISYHYSNTIEGESSDQLLDLINEFE